MRSQAPLPPARLAQRVGNAPGRDILFQFDEVGRQMRADLNELLPCDWSCEGRRVLDFGCGCGRLLRQLLTEAELAEIEGCDIDAEMVAWVDAHLSPPIAAAFVSNSAPPLPRPDSHYDLIVAASVFTHIAERWADWLLEMRRLLKPDGLLIATFLGQGMSSHLTDVPWDEDATSMNVLWCYQPNYPSILHAPWWIRAHWGRAFEILELREDGFGSAPGTGHGVVLMRPRPGILSPADLEREDHDDLRYLAARRQHVRQLVAEGERVRTFYHQHPAWRITAPLRAAGRASRRVQHRLPRFRRRGDR